MPRSQRDVLTWFAGSAVVAVLCLIVSGATRHHHGLARAASWVTFIGFWAALATIAALALISAAIAVRAHRSAR